MCEVLDEMVAMGQLEYRGGKKYMLMYQALRLLPLSLLERLEHVPESTSYFFVPDTVSSAKAWPPRCPDSKSPLPTHPPPNPHRATAVRQARLLGER